MVSVVLALERKLKSEAWHHGGLHEDGGNHLRQWQTVDVGIHGGCLLIDGISDGLLVEFSDGFLMLELFFYAVFLVDLELLGRLLETKAKKSGDWN